MLDRRGFILVAGVGGLLSACQSGPAKPSTVTVKATGQAGMNAGPDGADRPTTLLLLRLKALGAFNGADVFALQGDPAAALGADLVGATRLVVPPGGTASKVITFEPEAAYLGVVALVRDPSGRTTRASLSIPGESQVTAAVTLGGGGLALSRG